VLFSPLFFSLREWGSSFPLSFFSALQFCGARLFPLLLFFQAKNLERLPCRPFSFFTSANSTSHSRPRLSPSFFLLFFPQRGACRETKVSLFFPPIAYQRHNKGPSLPLFLSPPPRVTDSGTSFSFFFFFFSLNFSTTAKLPEPWYLLFFSSSGLDVAILGIFSFPLLFLFPLRLFEV